MITNLSLLFMWYIDICIYGLRLLIRGGGAAAALGTCGYRHSDAQLGRPAPAVTGR